jgi:phosphatidylinositol 3-kinase
MVVPPSYGDKKLPVQRMCSNCAKNSNEETEVEWLVQSLSIMPVTIREFFLLRVLDRKWNLACNTMLSFYRGLQYRLPCQPYSQLEINFLKTHFREFSRHVPWQIHTIISTANQRNWAARLNKPDFLNPISCKLALCSRTCCPTMSISDIIRLGITGTLKALPLQKWTIITWKHLRPHVHKKMMSWWVFLACKYRHLFKFGLIPIVKNSLDLIYSLWFECQLQKTESTRNMLSQVQEILEKNHTVAREIRKTFHLSNLMIKLARSPSEYNVRSFFCKNGPTRLPWNPGIILHDIREFNMLKSASKPVLCTFVTDKGNTKILIKNEDVRTDKLAMNISYWISDLTQNIIMPIYQVFPLTKEIGCVEMIPNATTLYDVRKNSTLLNFIMNKNSNTTVSVLRERMIASSAGACLLAYTMGLGDRHLENILITQGGYLVHVDFGYVFGDDPKRVTTPMRITEDMVDAMGGRTSDTFQSFIRRTQKGYESMRLYSSFWYLLLVSEYYIFHDNTRHWKRIRDHILNRFVPGEWEEEASLQIQSIVQSASQTSWFQRLADFTHLASNQMDDIFNKSI